MKFFNPSDSISRFVFQDKPPQISESESASDLTPEQRFGRDAKAKFSFLVTQYGLEAGASAGTFVQGETTLTYKIKASYLVEIRSSNGGKLFFERSSSGDYFCDLDTEERGTGESFYSSGRVEEIADHLGIDSSEVMTEKTEAERVPKDYTGRLQLLRSFIEKRDTYLTEIQSADYARNDDINKTLRRILKGLENMGAERHDALDSGDGLGFGISIFMRDLAEANKTTGVVRSNFTTVMNELATSEELREFMD